MNIFICTHIINRDNSYRYRSYYAHEAKPPWSH